MIYRNCYGEEFDDYDKALESMDSNALDYSDIIETAQSHLSYEEIIDVLEREKHHLYLWVLEKAWEENKERYVEEIEEEEEE